MKVYTIKFYFYGSKQIVPFEYENMLLSFLHNEILGKDNQYHDSTSLYSTSPLFNSKKADNGLVFERGAIWKIRTPNVETFRDFYLNGKNSIGKELGCGLVLKTVEYETNEFTDEKEFIIGTSPVYLGQNENSSTPDHITYKHGKDITTAHLKRTFLTKAKKLGYEFKENDFTIEFDLSYPIETKLKKIGTTPNVASQGRIRITGGPDVIGLCYGFGIGVSTGCGFGFCYDKK